MKTAIIILVVIIIIGAFYFFKPLKAPTIDVTEGIAVGEPHPATPSVNTYSINPDNSSVSFTIEEVLSGKDFTVVGKTNEVAATISVDPDDLSTFTLNTATVNARTLTTDADKRNIAIHRFILKTEDDANELLTFEAKKIDRLSSKTFSGVPITFRAIGDLTISGVTKRVAFDMTISSISDTEVVGEGTTQILYKDFDLTIPEVPFVASVEDEVNIIVDFTASR